MPSFNPNCIGSIQIGVFLSVFLHGITTVQIYTYFHNFPHDSKVLKSVVAVVWIADFGHVICTTHGIYEMTITNYGLPPNLIYLPASFPVASGFSGIAALVQATFIYRIYRLSKNPYMPAICSLLVIANLVGILTFMATALRVSRVLTMVALDNYLKKWNWLVLSIFSSTAFVDIIIAASLCYFLLEQRRKALKGTMSLIDKLILWTVQTGLLTSLTAIAIVITFATMRNNNVWLALGITITALYPNSLLATLNNRLRLPKPDAITPTPDPLPPLQAHQRTRHSSSSCSSIASSSPQTPPHHSHSTFSSSGGSPYVPAPPSSAVVSRCQSGLLLESGCVVVQGEGLSYVYVV